MKRGPRPRPIEERFQDYLQKGGDEECWGWLGPVNRQGYPTLGRGGKGAGQASARILAYRLAHLVEPEGLVVTTCGKTDCLNPRHLQLVSQKPGRTAAGRLWAKVLKGGSGDCWVWQGSTTNGYGYISMGRGVYMPAHRLVWQLERGEIPQGLLVRQKCENRLCCNPEHLFLALNAQDSPEVSEIVVQRWLMFSR